MEENKTAQELIDSIEEETDSSSLEENDSLPLKEEGKEEKSASIEDKPKEIKPMFMFKLEQYICPEDNLKFYINKDDQTEQTLKCPFCSTNTQNIREFSVGVESFKEKQ